MKNLFKPLIVLVAFTLNVFAFNYNSAWMNDNRNSRGFTKLIIKNSGTIRAFVDCHPQDCNLGEAIYTKTANGLMASWEESGKGYKVVLLEDIRREQIKVITKYLYYNGRRNATTVDYFHKVPMRQYFYKKFVGNWVNLDRNTRGLTRLDISKQGRNIYANIWTSCQRGECDQGRSLAIKSKQRLLMDLNRGTQKRRVTIDGIDRDRYGEFERLKVTISAHQYGRKTRPRVYFLQRERNNRR